MEAPAVLGWVSVFVPVVMSLLVNANTPADGGVVAQGQAGAVAIGQIVEDRRVTADMLRARAGESDGPAASIEHAAIVDPVAGFQGESCAVGLSAVPARKVQSSRGNGKVVDRGVRVEVDNDVVIEIDALIEGPAVNVDYTPGCRVCDGCVDAVVAG